MFEFFRKLFVSDFMPHGHCILWQPGMVWLRVISDFLITLSYFLIPIGLLQLVRKRRDLEFNWMYLMFGLFILSCGLTHAMNVWNIWHATYRLEGLIKAIAAVASLATSVLLFRVIPVALMIPSPAQLRLEIHERVKAEQEVRTLNSELEERVEERTESLQRSNQALQRFAYIASHDLQEPIRTIRSMNQLMARDFKGKIDSKADRYIEFVVVEASDRMQSLLVDLMSYAVVLDETAPRHVKQIDTTALVQSTLSDLRTAIEDSGAVISCEDLPPVFADESQVKQIFLNLLTNAIQYVPKGAVPRIFVTGSRSGEICTFGCKTTESGLIRDMLTKFLSRFAVCTGVNTPEAESV